jgi:hypothetical protein
MLHKMVGPILLPLLSSTSASEDINIRDLYCNYA